jgi:hypothetical protein
MCVCVCVCVCVWMRECRQLLLFSWTPSMFLSLSRCVQLSMLLQDLLPPPPPALASEARDGQGVCAWMRFVVA